MSDKAMSEMKPCPFCGESNQEKLVLTYMVDVRFAECLNCGASGPIAFNDPESAEVWNKRAELAAGNGWVGVGDELPELGDDVLTWNGKDFCADVFDAIREAPLSFTSQTIEVGEWFLEEDYSVSHWKPISPPEGE